MNPDQLKEAWKKEEDMAHIHGWDFSHIHGRYEEQGDLPWNYDAIIRNILKDEMKILEAKLLYLIQTYYRVARQKVA